MIVSEISLTEVANWLLSCNNPNPIAEAKPVSVSIGDDTFRGVFYRQQEFRTELERAVTDGSAKPGDVYYKSAIYILGEIPKKLNVNSLCFDCDGVDWYCAFYNDNRAVRLNSAASPFGLVWGIAPWEVVDYGPYKGHRIDTLTENGKPYKRLPMSFSFVGV